MVMSLTWPPEPPTIADGCLGIPDHRKRGAVDWCAAHHLRQDLAAVRKRDRAALRERRALRSFRHAERIEPLGEERVPDPVAK